MGGENSNGENNRSLLFSLSFETLPCRKTQIVSLRGRSTKLDNFYESHHFSFLFHFGNLPKPNCLATPSISLFYHPHPSSLEYIIPTDKSSSFSHQTQPHNTYIRHNIFSFICYKLVHQARSTYVQHTTFHSHTKCTECMLVPA